MKNKPHHVCILGCGRSGTSIFGEFFLNVPGYTYYSEPPFGDLPNYDYSHPVAFKVPRSMPADLEELWVVLPEPRVVFWQVRHPLDAICSLRIGIADNWGHHPRPPDWRDWLDRPILEQCAHHWNYINTFGYKQVRALAVVNRFEEMVQQPEAAARKICAVTGIDFERHAAALQPWIDRVQDGFNDRFVEAETSRPYSRPDHRRKVGRWQENLTREEVQLLLPLIEEGAANFAYDLSTI